MTQPKRTSGRLVVIGIFAIITVFAALIVIMALRADPPPPEPAPPEASLVPRQVAPPDAGTLTPSSKPTTNPSAQGD